VLHPEFVGALSYPILCLIGMLFHIIVLPAFSSRRIRPARWLIDGDYDALTIIAVFFRYYYELNSV
jgi:hypothetical protein